MPTPKVKIDEKKVARLALDGCQMRTIARIMDIDKQTLNSRCKTLIKKKRAERRHKLLKLQNKIAEGGDKSMLIFLGKAVLGQAERLEISGDKTSPLRLVVHEYGEKKEEKADGET